MEQVWKFRRLCINVAEEYDFLFVPLLKFVVAFLAFSTINKEIGYMTRLDNMFILLALSLLSAVLPNMVMIMLAAVLLILQSYGVHLFACVFVVLMLLLLYIFLQRFSDKYSLLLILTPLAMHFGLAPVVAVAGGLLLEPVALLPICSGTLIYAIISVVAQCAATIHGVEIKEFTTVITQLLDSVMGKTDTVLLLIIMASVFLIVYALRRLSVAYSWQIALVCGAVAFLVLLMAGGFFMETSMTAGKMFPGILAAVLLGELLVFFCSGLEYTKTQRLQFEDDDYYYYVKAVPKIDGDYFDEDEEEEPEIQTSVRPERQSVKTQTRPGRQLVKAQTRPERQSVKTQTSEPVRPAQQDVQIDDLESRLEKAMQEIQE